MDKQKVYTDLQKSGCWNLKHWTGGMATTIEEFSEYILNEYGEDSEQAKMYNITKANNKRLQDEKMEYLKINFEEIQKDVFKDGADGWRGHNGCYCSQCFERHGGTYTKWKILHGKVAQKWEEFRLHMKLAGKISG